MDLKKHYTKDTQMEDKDIKGCSTSLVWREIHRPLYTHKIAKMKKTTQVLNEDTEQPHPYAEYTHPVLCLSQSCPTLDPGDCSPPGTPVHGDSLGRNTGVGCHPSARASSQPRGQTQVSHIAGRFFTIWATREVQENWNRQHIPSPGELPNPGALPTREAQLHPRT